LLARVEDEGEETLVKKKDQEEKTQEGGRWWTCHHPPVCEGFRKRTLMTKGVEERRP